MPAVKPKLVLRRPPDDFLELLPKRDSELEAIIQQLESHPLFEQLVSAGIVRRVRYRTFIPRRYLEEHGDKWLVTFLRKYGITKQAGWESDLLTDNAMEHVEKLAKKYGVPVKEMRRAINCIQRLLHDSSEVRPALRAELDEEAHEWEAVDAGWGDLSEAIAVAEEFVHKYRVTEREFAEDILGGRMGVEELCARYGCSVPEARRLLDCILHVQVLEILEEDAQWSPQPRAITRGDVPFEIVGYAHVTAGGWLSIQFRDERLHGMRYLIDEERLRSFLRSCHDEEVHRLINSLRYINQWRSLLGRVVWIICREQQRFIISGDELMLKPLPQAEVARQLGHHRSHVCRVIRHRGIATPHGKYSLSFLCPSKERVIWYVAKRYPDWTDQQIADFLFHYHGCRIPRRTVSYHRAKIRHMYKPER